MADYKSTGERIQELRKLAENAPPNIREQCLREVEHLETLMTRRHAEILRLNKAKNIKISERLQEVMELKQLTAADIAEGTGIPTPVIQAYVAGNHTPSNDQITILAKYLNVSELWLLGRDVPMLYNSEKISCMEVRTIKLEWKTLDAIFGAIFKEILGKTIKCEADFDTYDYWGVRFVNYEMPLDEIETVCSSVQANEKEHKDAFPAEDENVSRDFGEAITSKLLSKHLGYTWKKEFADEDALYLIECADF